jgi:hypothetical protein
VARRVEFRWCWIWARWKNWGASLFTGIDGRATLYADVGPLCVQWKAAP